MLQKALAEAVLKLEKAEKKGLLLDFALIGGFAVSAWGYPRATEDIDFAISIDRNLLSELAKFLKGELIRGDSSDPLIATINFEIQSQLIQLIVFPQSWNSIAFQDVQLINLEESKIPVVSWKSIVLLKLYAGSERDLYDAKKIIEAQEPGQRSLESLREVAKKMRVSKKFDRIV